MSGCPRHAGKREKGSILAIAILLSVFMVIVAIPFVTKFSSRMRTTEKSFDSYAAVNLAEAGIERAIWEINYGNISGWSGSSSLRTLTISNFQASGGAVVGNISISVTNPGGDNPVVESTGTVVLRGASTLSRTIRVVLQQTSPPLFGYGVFGHTGIELANNALIDSYDHNNGLYGGSNIYANGDIGTNATGWGSVYLNNNAVVNGDAKVGYQGNPSTAIYQESGSVINGTKSALSAAKSMPSVPAPTGLTYRGDYYAGWFSNRTISASGQYHDFTLDWSSTVTVTADCTLYITGGFSLGNSSQFKIAAGVSCTIYFAGDWSINNNAQINNISKDPTKLVMLGTDSFNGTQNFANGTSTYAAMYFPKANLQMYNNAAVYGSVIANYVEQHNNAALHYDEALADFRPAFAPPMTYGVKSWQEKLI